jgi:hypothetical protein
MHEFEVEVIGAKPPRKPEGRLARTLRLAGRLARALLTRPRAMLLTGLAAFVLFVGTPHVGWDYGCRHPIRLGQTCRSVSYCAYYGFQGRRIVFPRDGESCQLIKFLPIDWRQLFWGKAND